MPYLKMEEEILNSLDIISRMKEPDRSEALKSYLHQIKIILNKPFVSILDK